MQGLRLKEQGESGEMKEPEIKEVQILLSSKEDPVSMRLLGVSMVLFCQFLGKVMDFDSITNFIMLFYSSKFAIERGFCFAIMRLLSWPNLFLIHVFV